MQERNFLKESIGLYDTYEISKLELSERSTRYLYLCLDFLRDNNRFPNPEINSLIEFIFQLLNEGDIPLFFEHDSSVDPIRFSVTYSNESPIPVHVPQIVMGGQFFNLANENPQATLCNIVIIASMCRDYWAGKIKPGISSEEFIPSRSRIEAFVGETVLTLDRLAAHEGYILPLEDAHRDILTRFPQGLKNLNPLDRYPTPPYKKIYGEGAAGIIKP